jgi:hypothetical protein
MPRTPRWTEFSFDRGVEEIRLSAWRWFADYVNQELLDYTTYIYRGHANSVWKLEPTLDRVIQSPRSLRRRPHLDAFKYSVRGRRGPNPAPLRDENEWWALGQHNGLLTPLLDWTESPFVALYFAIVNARTEAGSHCCVWALSQSALRSISNVILKDDSILPVDGRKPIVETIRPLNDENYRLVNQRGLFTRGPDNIDIEEWIKDYYDKDAEGWNLIKIVIPKTGTDDCLRYLNRMNINHATLFPDLYGASIFCNMELRIRDY